MSRRGRIANSGQRNFGRDRHDDSVEPQSIALISRAAGSTRDQRPLGFRQLASTADDQRALAASQPDDFHRHASEEHVPRAVDVQIRRDLIILTRG